MNKKLFFAGFALLAAVSFTSCNSDNPIDVTDPNGVRPVNSAHYLGGSYDWTAVVKDYAQLQEFWAADKDAVKKALEDSKANTVNILLDVSGYELKNEVIKLPDFWQDGKTNGKVVNITFQGNFKNADFERAHAIDKVDNVAKMSKFPVKIDANTLVSSEVNFTFNVEKFDLVIETREARSTFSGNYTIGYMMAKADVQGNDALEIKEGTVEGVDIYSTGKFKGAFGGVWTKVAFDNINVASNGIMTLSGDVVPGSKNIYLEKDASVDTWYMPNGWSWAQYKLGTVKFVQKAGSFAQLRLNGINGNGPVTEDAIENIVGFDKALCYVWTSNKQNALKNIDAMEKVTVTGSTVNLKKDIFSDVRFTAPAKYNTKDIDTFADVTFNFLTVTVHADNQTLTYNGVNFNTKVILKSGIKETEQTGYYEKLYQWIIDNTITRAGHFELVDDDHPVLDANKDKAVVVFADTDIKYSGTTETFYKVNGSDAQLAEATSSYLVLITHTDTDETVYIPEGTSVLLNGCKFLEPTTGNMNTTNTALNNIWGNNPLWDEQCWYTVYVDGTKYNWRKSEKGGSISTVWYVLYPAAE